ncbi:MAG TPA: hypothetical protein VJO35_05090 [Terriglobales bacterium]|nr:hypothetical protein [Terriglobales bacterium]
MFSKQVMWIAFVFGLALPLSAQTEMQPKALCEQAFTIPAHSAKTCAFIVPEGHVAKLEGHFQATGGPRNTIEVWVMDDDAYVNWENHHASRALYNSQKATVGTVRLVLRPGKYHVAFDNLFSIMTPKAIEANFALEFKTLTAGVN